MIRILFLTTTLSIAAIVNGQMKTSIELDLIGRYDKHADYTTRFGGRSYTDDIQLWGLSYGANLNLRHRLTNRLALRMGVGYYKLVVDKISRSTRFNTRSPARPIDYNHPTGIQPLFYTEYYYYNNLALSGGFAYEGKINKRLFFNVGGEYTYLYSFSQLYNIDYDNSKFRAQRGRSLGFEVNAYLGVVRHIANDKHYINPKIILPVYQKLSGDEVFGEDESLKMQKWLNGVGLSFTIGKYLRS